MFFQGRLHIHFHYMSKQVLLATAALLLPLNKGYNNNIDEQRQKFSQQRLFWGNLLLTIF